MQNHHEEDIHSAEYSHVQQALLYQLCQAVLPLWANQIDAAKTLTNSSIDDLSAKFSGLSSSIRTVTNGEHTQSNEHLIALLNQSQQQLATVINLLKTSIDEKKSLLQAISALSNNTKELLDMADIVTRIAKETGMVAVNAAIEAARVGERGRGFAVVADAVKRLSSDAGRTGLHISDTVNRVSGAIRNVSKVSKEIELKDAQTLVEAEQIVGKVIGEFGQAANKVVDSSQQMLNESQHVAEEIDQVLFSLQFQDRVSQMLTHVQQDISKLNAKVDHDEDMGSVDEWLDALESTYTMREQNRIHNQTPATVASNSKKSIRTQSPEPTPDSGDITFF